MTFEVVVLAAGQGKRMCSDKPKVLHDLAGKPMLAHVVDQAGALNPSNIHIVYGHQGARIQAAFSDRGYQFIHQAQQLGTGHAVQQCLPSLNPDHHVIILVGDAPLIKTSTLQKLLDVALNSDLTLLTAEVDDPFGLGRILSEDDGQVKAIIEEKDATESQKAIKEINTGIMVCRAELLQDLLPQLKSNNAQAELYLTDIVGLAVSNGRKVNKLKLDDPREAMGVNDMLQLEQAERFYQLRQLETLMKQGVLVRDKKRVDIRGELICGKGVVIDCNVVFEGRVSLADNVTIGANCFIKDSTIGEAAVIHPNSMIDGSSVATQAQVGPFARLRVGSSLEERSRVGNFVEIKNSKLGIDSKASHLSYLGDSHIGSQVNIGAGTITCNYDGVAKHRTTIGNNAFIGSGTQLVAPIEVGENATIGAGTTLRRNAPAGELTLSKTQQQTIAGWKSKKTQKQN